jgi:hypothetical protein
MLVWLALGLGASKRSARKGSHSVAPAFTDEFIAAIPDDHEVDFKKVRGLLPEINQRVG